ncbi:hypothetical protein RhiTH_003965 [Rhizoctonia solani]
MEVVLAHPNGWGIRKQALLRLGAVKAGFTKAKDAATWIHFVNEAEASVHFCTLYSDIGIQLKPETTFAVCDAGGSTVDTTMYSIKNLNPIRLEETWASDSDNERRSQVHIFMDGENVQTKETKITELKASSNGLRAVTEIKKDSEIDRLSAELHRTTAEYASLRNHMQLQENIETSRNHYRNRQYQ